jgi:tetratricopeptide (TPR) repeat protein
LYNTGFDYGYGWPYYIYDPSCVCPPVTYVDPPVAYLDSPAYAAVPGSSASIATDAVSGDPAPARISARSADSNYIPPKLDESAEASAADFAREGEVAFRSKDYKQAVREWRHALLDDPQNGTLLLMMSQALFQMGEYNESAGALQAGLKMLPRDKWHVVVGNYKELYSDVQEYVDQLKALEKSVKDKPKDPALRLLVGYHYLYLGYPNEALRELKVGEESAKSDQAMKQLIKVAEEEIQKKSGESPPPAETPKKPDVE